MSLPITATYRLQLRSPESDPQGRGFDFAAAENILDYLHDLGVSHVYLSPITVAAPSSTHGYDVLDPTVINPALGGKPAFVSFAQAAHAKGMGVIIDWVPNHVGVATPKDNPWWWDVLTYGKDSDYEQFFDIDWGEDNGADGKIGLPVLGSSDDIAAIEIDTVDGVEVARYYDHIFPIRPGTVSDSVADTLEKQCYKLLDWASGTIGYRRFFSVSDLAGIRQERPAVFETTHRLIRELIDENLIDGIRVDHPDGLADPFGYLAQLRALMGNDKWLVVEKILGVEEPLDPRLAADGTTGYDALREFDGIFISREAEPQLSLIAFKHSGSPWDDSAVAATEKELKKQVAKGELAAEVTRLARACRRDNFSTAGDNVSDDDLKDTIVELVSEMPVYRADYISLSRVRATVIAHMTHKLPHRRDALDLIAAALIADGEASTRFAQVCGAVMAKGVEDTTFYRACRLVALQEVGGAPGRFGVGPAEFHLLQKERRQLWPQAMTSLSTHDTKRGEDVRARVIELTDAPHLYEDLVEHVTAVTPPPHGATGLFLLQNLIGTWPRNGEIDDTYRQRMHDYAQKAMREAEVISTWTQQDEEAEQQILDWIDALFDGPATAAINEFVATIADPAVQVSCSRKLLQLLAPGVPDVYQGTEYVEDSLVDPDNRRFVDYEQRQESLKHLRGAENLLALTCPATGKEASMDVDADASRAHYPLIATHPDVVKQAIVAQALNVRRSNPQLFAKGTYQPVFGVGVANNHVIGFVRSTPITKQPQVIALGVRRPLTLAKNGGWQDTTVTLPSGRWVDQLTGRSFSGTVAAAELYQYLPAVLLVVDDSDS